jgi:transposase-like protein
MRKRIDFYCPHCKNKKRITINDEFNESNINSLLDRSIFKVKCNKCNNETIIDYNFILKTKNYSISYGKSKDVNRITYTYDDFKEKVLIFEDKLNDILIELMKKKLNHDINSNHELRYDGMNKTQLIFYSIDSNESYAMNKELYEYYKNKYKIEDIKDIEITSDNFDKYIK